MVKFLILFIGLQMTNFLYSDQPIKAIIFDCDGTLVDSEEAHLSAWQQTLQNRGADLTLEQRIFYTGKTTHVIAKHIAESIGSDCPEAIIAEKRVHYKELHKRGLPPIEATVDFLKRLAKEKERLGLKLGVASAGIKSDILDSLKHLGIEDLFDVVLSGQDDLTDYTDPEGVNKPKPYVYLHAAKLLNVLPEECVAIEDSSTGVASSTAAGCITIAIPNRHTEMQDLSAATFKMESLSGIGVDEFLQIVMARVSR
jgi:HAD superfamily hydrolase (TIGR01509 family)